MPRSRFEQLIDAGLASPQAEPARPAGMGAPSRTKRVAIPELELSAREIGAAKPHLSARDLRRAYRDWQSPGADQGEPVAETYQNAGNQSGFQTGPRSSSQPEPGVPDLLAQLADHSRLTRQQLQSLRRQLARRLHPDLAAPQERHAATAEMARLNAIVDSALRAR